MYVLWACQTKTDKAIKEEFYNFEALLAGLRKYEYYHYVGWERQ